jgi:S-DNA-T family DNA segregation ATPase FtsK/SpoIIIE
MPHILIAGTTGSGKSVGVNGMICSLLYHCSPEEVRFLMVDPKMLELSIYNGIPHLLLPVVTDPKKAAVALNWAVAEMERRYALMAEAGVRGIGKYNDLIKRRQRVRDWHRQREQEADATRRAALGADIWDEEDEILDVADVQKQSDEGDYFEKLPYIVVIIDELADLMMVASKDVEISIARLAQKARAAGIHLMVATQRPSVDVLTGMIKANFPARLAFQLKSKIDSRTILDAMGAERLLGMGDMLLIPPGRSNPVRLHGPYISEEEIHQIVKHLKTQGEPDYKDEILAGGLDEEEDEDGFDALYDQALEFVVQSRKASANALQKEFKIGNSRASRLIDQLEEQGIIGPKNGTKPRDILLPPPGEDLLL